VPILYINSKSLSSTSIATLTLRLYLSLLDEGLRLLLRPL
jgi:hypothetical protein